MDKCLYDVPEIEERKVLLIIPLLLKISQHFLHKLNDNLLAQFELAEPSDHRDQLLQRIRSETAIGIL